MTKAEAIKYAKENIIAYTSEMAEFKVLAIEALEKQIPKKPNKLTCPRCGFDRIDNSWWVFTYCPDCGQAIDWSEED